MGGGAEGRFSCIATAGFFCLSISISFVGR